MVNQLQTPLSTLCSIDAAIVDERLQTPYIRIIFSRIIAFSQCGKRSMKVTMATDVSVRRGPYSNLPLEILLSARSILSGHIYFISIIDSA